jgi:hypothetical protein
MKAFIEKLSATPTKTEHDEITLVQMTILVDFLSEQYADKLSLISTLLADGDITYELFWALFIPKMILYTTCPTTRRPIAMRLLWSERVIGYRTDDWHLECEYFDTLGPIHSETRKRKRFYFNSDTRIIPSFKGKRKIAGLSIYPMDRHKKEIEMREKLIERGKRWVALDGMHHRFYNEVAWFHNGYGLKRVLVCFVPPLFWLPTERNSLILDQFKSDDR